VLAVCNRHILSVPSFHPRPSHALFLQWVRAVVDGNPRARESPHHSLQPISDRHIVDSPRCSGGYAESCINCADSINICGSATCTTATDANCLFCNQRVEFGASYVLSAPNTCTACPPYTYRSNNATCTACPKANTCAAATCQANSGVTRLTGQASMSSIYGGAFNGGVTLSQYLARWGDGVVTFNPIGPHSGTSTALGDLTNPWLQVDLGANVAVTGIDRLVLYNRDGTWACRLLSPTSGCRNVFSQLTRTWNQANQGAIMGLSNSPLTTAMTTFYPNQCNNPGDTNCRCGFITRYNATNNNRGPYTLSCNGAVGRYAWVSSCSTNSRWALTQQLI
jgi:hypothetical protein